MKGLLWWIDCLRGRHLWAQIDTPLDGSFVVCIHCGERL